MEDIKLESKEFNIFYKDDPSIGEEIFKKILKWCIKYEIFSGESLMQSDDGAIYSPELVSDILDKVIKFKVEWKD